MWVTVLCGTVTRNLFAFVTDFSVTFVQLNCTVQLYNKGYLLFASMFKFTEFKLDKCVKDSRSIVIQ